jgi:hypothetical protein
VLNSIAIHAAATVVRVLLLHEMSSIVDVSRQQRETDYSSVYQRSTDAVFSLKSTATASTLRQAARQFRDTRNRVAYGPGSVYISDIPKLLVFRRMRVNSFQYSETGVNTLQELGRIIREQRRASGLRIDDAAALCGVSVDLLSRLENGHSGVSTARVLKVLDGLGLAMLVVAKARLRSTVAAANSKDP